MKGTALASNQAITAEPRCFFTETGISVGIYRMVSAAGSMRCAARASGRGLNRVRKENAETYSGFETRRGAESMIDSAIQDMKPSSYSQSTDEESRNL